MKILGFILYIFFALNVLAQQSRNENYLTDLKLPSSDTASIKLLLEYAKDSFDLDRHKSLVYTDEAFQLSKKIKNNFWLASSYLQYSFYYLHTGDFRQSIQYNESALELFKKENKIKEIGITFLERAYIYLEFVNYPKALIDAQNALKIFHKIKDTKNIAKTNNLIGETYRLLGNNQKALDVFEKAIKESGNIDISTIALWINIGTIYRNIGNYQKALSYYAEVCTYCEKNNLRQFNGYAYTLNRIARVYLLQKKGEDALKKALKSLEIYQQTGLKQGQVLAINTLAEYYQAKGAVEKSVEYAQKSLSVAKEINMIQEGMMEAYKLLSKGFALQKNFAQAYQYHLLYTTLNDSLFSEENNNRITQILISTETEKKQTEIELLQKDKQLRNAEIRANKVFIQRQYIIGIAIFIILAFAIVLSFILYGNNLREQKSNLLLKEQKEEVAAQAEELAELNEELKSINNKLEDAVIDRTKQLKKALEDLDLFLYRSSHDLRRPLTTIMGLVQVAKITEENVDLLQLFDKVDLTAIGMDKMLAKLRMISTLDNINPEEGETIDFEGMLLRIRKYFSSLIQKHEIDFIYKITEPIDFKSNPEYIQIILQNLIENSISYYARENPYVETSIFADNAYLVIKVKDNGLGISEEYKHRIFEMYFRANEKSQGNGLGLYLTRKAVEKLEGHISFKSEQYKFTEFIVAIPSKL